MESAVRMTGPLDPRAGWRADRCSIAAALEVIGTRSSFLILREAFYGTSRFDDFARRAGISAPVAAERLRELVGHGLLAREPYREPGQRTRERYRLTRMGVELFPALAALLAWGDRWLEGGGGVELRHQECGARVAPELRCAAGHAVEPGALELAARRVRARAPQTRNS
jgi:DNA-binding HxlR family transcriptional regulator